MWTLKNNINAANKTEEERKRKLVNRIFAAMTAITAVMVIAVTCMFSVMYANAEGTYSTKSLKSYSDRLIPISIPTTDTKFSSAGDNRPYMFTKDTGLGAIVLRFVDEQEQGKDPASTSGSGQWLTKRSMEYSSTKELAKEGSRYSYGMALFPNYTVPMGMPDAFFTNEDRTELNDVGKLLIYYGTYGLDIEPDLYSEFYDAVLEYEDTSDFIQTQKYRYKSIKNQGKDAIAFLNGLGYMPFNINKYNAQNTILYLPKSLVNSGSKQFTEGPTLLSNRLKKLGLQTSSTADIIQKLMDGNINVDSSDIRELGPGGQFLTNKKEAADIEAKAIVREQVISSMIPLMYIDDNGNQSNLYVMKGTKDLKQFIVNGRTIELPNVSNSYIIEGAHYKTKKTASQLCEIFDKAVMSSDSEKTFKDLIEEGVKRDLNEIDRYYSYTKSYYCENLDEAYNILDLLLGGYQNKVDINGNNVSYGHRDTLESDKNYGSGTFENPGSDWLYTNVSKYSSITSEKDALKLKFVRQMQMECAIAAICEERSLGVTCKDPKNNIQISEVNLFAYFSSKSSGYYYDGADVKNGGYSADIASLFANKQGFFATSSSMYKTMYEMVGSCCVTDDTEIITAAAFDYIYSMYGESGAVKASMRVSDSAGTIKGSYNVASEDDTTMEIGGIFYYNLANIGNMRIKSTSQVANETGFANLGYGSDYEYQNWYSNSEYTSGNDMLVNMNDARRRQYAMYIASRGRTKSHGATVLSEGIYNNGFFESSETVMFMGYVDGNKWAPITSVENIKSGSALDITKSDGTTTASSKSTGRYMTRKVSYPQKVKNVDVLGGNTIKLDSTRLNGGYASNSVLGMKYRQRWQQGYFLQSDGSTIDLGDAGKDYVQVQQSYTSQVAFETIAMTADLYKKTITAENANTLKLKKEVASGGSQFWIHYGTYTSDDPDGIPDNNIPKGPPSDDGIPEGHPDNTPTPGGTPSNTPTPTAKPSNTPTPTKKPNATPKPEINSDSEGSANEKVPAIMPIFGFVAKDKDGNEIKNTVEHEVYKSTDLFDRELVLGINISVPLEKYLENIIKENKKDGATEESKVYMSVQLVGKGGTLYYAGKDKEGNLKWNASKVELPDATDEKSFYVDDIGGLTTDLLSVPDKWADMPNYCLGDGVGIDGKYTYTPKALKGKTFNTASDIELTKVFGDTLAGLSETYTSDTEYIYEIGRWRFGDIYSEVAKKESTTALKMDVDYSLGLEVSFYKVTEKIKEKDPDKKKITKIARFNTTYKGDEYVYARSLQGLFVNNFATEADSNGTMNIFRPKSKSLSSYGSFYGPDYNYNHMYFQVKSGLACPIDGEAEIVYEDDGTHLKENLSAEDNEAIGTPGKLILKMHWVKGDSEEGKEKNPENLLLKDWKKKLEEQGVTTIMLRITSNGTRTVVNRIDDETGDYYVDSSGWATSPGGDTMFIEDTSNERIVTLTLEDFCKYIDPDKSTFDLDNAAIYRILAWNDMKATLEENGPAADGFIHHLLEYGVDVSIIGVKYDGEESSAPDYWNKTGSHLTDDVLSTGNEHLRFYDLLVPTGDIEESLLDGDSVSSLEVLELGNKDNAVMDDFPVPKHKCYLEAVSYVKAEEPIKLKILRGYCLPLSYAEIKEGNIVLDDNYAEQSYDALSGVPSTEKLYIASGGSEFIVELGFAYIQDEETIRSYTSLFKDIDCKFRKPDTSSAGGGGAGGMTVNKDAISHAYNDMTVVGQLIDTFNLPDPEQPTGGNWTVTEHAGQEIWAQWTGTIANTTSNPGVENTKSPIDEISTSTGYFYSGEPGNMVKTGQESSEGSYSWAVDKYNQALNFAEAWALKIEGYSDGAGNIITQSDSDGRTRSWHAGDAKITVQIAGVNNVSPNEVHTSAHYGTWSDTTRTTDNLLEDILKPNDIRLSSGYFEFHGTDMGVTCTSCKGTKTITGSPTSHEQELTWTDEYELSQFEPQSMSRDIKTGCSSSTSSHDYTTTTVEWETKWCGHDEAKNLKDGKCKVEAIPDSTSYSHSFSGAVTDLDSHTCEASHTTTPFSATKTIAAPTLNYTITVKFVGTYTEGQGYSDEDTTVQKTTCPDGIVQEHCLCGPCCRHHLPAVSDKWFQKLKYSYISIEDIQVYKIFRSHVEGINNLTFDYDDKNTLTTHILHGDPNVWYNIGEMSEDSDYKYSNTLHDKKRNASLAGRLRYTVQAQQLDDVLWTERNMEQDKIARTQDCDGMAKNRDSSANPAKDGGMGHKEKWALGILYKRDGSSYTAAGNTKNDSWRGYFGYDEHPEEFTGENEEDEAYLDYIAGNTSDKKERYSNNSLDDIDLNTIEYKRWKERRETECTVYLLSDMLILQTSTGDRRVIYGESNATRQCQQHYENCGLNVSEEDCINAAETGEHENVYEPHTQEDGTPRVEDYTFGNTLLGGYMGNGNVAIDRDTMQIDGISKHTAFSGGNITKVETKLDSNKEDYDATMKHDDDKAVVKGPRNFKEIPNVIDQEDPEQYKASAAEMEKRMERVDYLKIGLLDIQIDPTKENELYRTEKATQTWIRIIDWKDENREGDTEGGLGIQGELERVYEPELKKDGFIESDSDVWEKEAYYFGTNKINNVVIHSPISNKNNGIISLAQSPDQRTNYTPLELFVDEYCPGTAALCKNRYLDCEYYNEKVMYSTGFEWYTKVGYMQAGSYKEKNKQTLILSDTTYTVIDSVNSVLSKLPNGVSIDDVGIFGTGNSLIMNYDAMTDSDYTIKLRDLEMTHQYGKRYKIEMSIKLSSKPPKNQILFSIGDLKVYVPQNESSIMIEDDAGGNIKFADANVVGSAVNIAVTISYDTIEDSSLTVNGVSKAKTQVNAANSLNPNCIGSTMKIGDASNRALMYVDNIVITKLAGLSAHNKYCYEEYFVHETSVNYTCDEPTILNYTGTVQTFTAPVSGTYLFECYGAAGGSANTKSSPLANGSTGGLGGYASGKVYLVEGQTVYAYVGGQGTLASALNTGGGYNGGGHAGPGGYGGGGMTHISFSESGAANSQMGWFGEEEREEVFEYTGGEQVFVAPETGEYSLEVLGAQGGTAGNNKGGLGGQSTGTITLKKGDKLYVYVGGSGKQGENAVGGYNGGGKASSDTQSTSGGGMTHISKKQNPSISNVVWNPEGTLIAAGGGGGAGSNKGSSGTLNVNINSNITIEYQNGRTFANSRTIGEPFTITTNTYIEADVISGHGFKETCLSLCRVTGTSYRDVADPGNTSTDWRKLKITLTPGVYQYAVCNTCSDFSTAQIKGEERNAGGGGLSGQDGLKDGSGGTQTSGGIGTTPESTGIIGLGGDAVATGNQGTGQTLTVVSTKDNITDEDIMGSTGYVYMGDWFDHDKTSHIHVTTNNTHGFGQCIKLITMGSDGSISFVPTYDRTAVCFNDITAGKYRFVINRYCSEYSYTHLSDIPQGNHASFGGAGGGGYYGGSGSDTGYGGGGSGFIGGVNAGETNAGINSGNGKAIIRWISKNTFLGTYEGGASLDNELNPEEITEIYVGVDDGSIELVNMMTSGAEVTLEPGIYLIGSRASGYYAYGLYIIDEPRTVRHDSGAGGGAGEGGSNSNGDTFEGSVGGGSSDSYVEILEDGTRKTLVSSSYSYHAWTNPDENGNLVVVPGTGSSSGTSNAYLTGGRTQSTHVDGEPRLSVSGVYKLGGVKVSKGVLGTYVDFNDKGVFIVAGGGGGADASTGGEAVGSSGDGSGGNGGLSAGNAKVGGVTITADRESAENNTVDTGCGIGGDVNYESYRGGGECVLNNVATGGGGGGWNGGYTSNVENGGGGGGSSYSSSSAGGTKFQTGVNFGNGKVVITLVDHEHNESCSGKKEDKNSHTHKQSCIQETNQNVIRALADAKYGNVTELCKFMGVSETDYANSYLKAIVDGMRLNCDEINVAVSKLQAHIGDVPDKVSGNNNPILSCYNHNDTHVCGETCKIPRTRKVCDEPHHEGSHYGMDSEICYTACNDDTKHVTVKPPTNSNGQITEYAEYIKIDDYFEIYWDNYGDFYDERYNVEWQRYVRNFETVQRGQGFYDNMDTTRWIRAKVIVFDNLNVLFYNEHTGLWEQYNAGEPIFLPVVSDGVIGNGNDDVLFRDWHEKDQSAKAVVNYKFYALLANHEYSGTQYRMYTFALNDSETTVDKHNVYELSTKDMVTTMNFIYDNKERHLSMDDSQYCAYEECYNKHEYDVVGSIGNMLVTNVTDFRFSNFFKQSTGEWLVQPFIYKVDEGKQNKYLNIGLNIDLRGRSVEQETGWFDTWRTQQWSADATPVVSIINADIRQMIATEDTEMLLGYKAFTEVTTIGDYNTVQVYPKVYVLDTYTNKVYYADMWSKQDTDYVPYYISNMTAYEAIDMYNYGLGELTDSKYDLIRNCNFVEYPAELSFGTEKRARNVTVEELERTTELVRKYTEYTVGDYDEEGRYVSVTTYADTPIESLQKIGDMNLLELTFKAMTLTGSSTTNTEWFNGVYNTNIENKQPEEFYEYQARRWHFTLGLAENSVALPLSSEFEGGKHLNANNLLSDLTNPLDIFYTDYNEDGTSRYVIMLGIDTYSLGDVWKLEYEAFEEPQTIKVHGKDYTLSTAISDIVAIFDMKGENEDYNIIKTH